MAIYYHGTKADNLESILKDGFNQGDCNWNASEPNMTYFWSPENLADADRQPYEEDVKQWHNRAFEMAGDSAFFACGTAKDCRRIIIAVNLTSKFDVTPDESCQNMDGAVCVYGNIPASNIVGIWIDGCDLAMLKGYFIAMREGMDLAVDLELSPLEKTLAKAMKNLEITDELSELRWSMKRIHGTKEVPID